MNDPVPKLQKLLGSPVVFINWPKGVKATNRKWGHLTVDDMTPEHLAKLPQGNIGVGLGKVSGNLCAIDLDDDALVEPFLAINPQLRDTLQTRGSRGRVFWARFVGKYPQKTVKLKAASRADAGEFRSNGSQSIVWGIHPGTQKPYEFVVEQPVVEVEFSSIQWPKQISNPPIGGLKDDTEETEVQSDGVTDAISVTLSSRSSLSSPSLCLTVESVEHAVELAMPTKDHQNHERLFTLARAVKNLESQAAIFTPAQLRNIFNLWHDRAGVFLRPEQTRDDYFVEFMNAYASAKKPLGDNAINEAWKLAQEKPLPPEADIFEDAKKRRLVALCRELQDIAGKEPFYLSARTVQRLLQLDSHATAARWLRSLCVLQILTEIEKGSGVRASRYRFNFTSV